MSLDIWLEVNGEEVVDKNITHNLSKMWREAEIYEALYESKGKTAKEVIPTLEEGLQAMIAEPERFKQLDSPNGWGTYKHALPWLAELIAEFKEYPDGIIGVSR